MKLFVFWFLILLCMVNLELAVCYKCYYENFRRREYHCNINPDSSSIEEKHVGGKTDDDVDEIVFNGTLNSISHLTQSDLTPICQRFKKLKEIQICGIKSVDENLLKQCKSLKEVHIRYSEIEEIPEKLVFEHPQLIYFFLYMSKLKTLPKDVFLNQKELDHLDLHNNQISFLPPNIFKSLTKLEFLNLEHNKIKSLNPKWFENLQLLRRLQLDDNEIQDLPKNVFTRLENLLKLELYNNQLKTIHSDSFGIHRKLKYISLGKNKINAIDEKFIDNTAVEELGMWEDICINENINERIQMKQKLSKCINNYQPRKDQSKH